MDSSFDLIIIGGGITGQAAALAAGQSGFKAALIDARDMDAASQDGRAYALAPASMRLLTRLGLELEDSVQPIDSMHITDGNALSPWTLDFGSSKDNSGDDTPQAHMPQAHMIESEILYALIRRAAADHPNIQSLSQQRVSHWDYGQSHASLTLENGSQLTAPLIIAADGYKSPTRQSAGIETTNTPYGQHALVTTIFHSLPHKAVALQRFLKGGPLAVLPLTQQRCQIVWSDKSTAINAALALPDDAFCALLLERVGPQLGEISLSAPRQSYPLISQIAESFTAPRLALIGDAAHVIHPLAGQGLNLGLRDVAALIHCLEEARSTGQDIGGFALDDYARWRRADTQLMHAMTDSLHRLYSSPSSLTQHLRRAGLATLNETDVLKHFIMDEAAGNTGDLPSLMKM